MQRKDFTKEEKSRKEGEVANAAPADSKKKMPPKENRTSRPLQGQNRKRRLIPPKALPVDGMREAAQLARSYMCEIEHNQGIHHQGRHIPDLGIPFSYEQLLNADAKLARELSLISQLHSNGVVPAHLLNVDPGSMAINKRPFLADAAEETRMKRLRKLVNLTPFDETLEYQVPAPPKYGSNHNNSPLLPTPPVRPLGFFDLRNKDVGFPYLHKSQSAPYSSNPPSPTPHSKGAMISKEMRLDSSAFPSSTLKLDAAADGFYDAKDKQQIKRPAYLPHHHFSPEGSAEKPRSSFVQFPGNNNLNFNPFDGILRPHNGTLTPIMSRLINGEQKSQMMMMSDAAYLNQIGQEVPMGLPQLNRQELAAYLGHLAAPQQHESSITGQREESIKRPNTLPSNPSAGILPLPGRLEFDGSKNSNNNLISLGCFSPDAGVLPLPGRSELSQMASLQREIPAAGQGLNGTQHSLVQPLQFPLLSTPGDIASLQEELSDQRSGAGNMHRQYSFFPSSQMQNNLQLMNHEVSAERAMGRHHHLLSPLTFQNDLASLQQNHPAASAVGGQHRIPLEGDLCALQQEVSAQRLHNSFLHPSPLPNDLASLQHELLSQRLNAGNPPLLQSLARESNLALLQQDLAGHGFSGGYHPLLQTLPVQGDLGTLQRELDFQRLNCASHPLVQASLQQHLSVPNFHGGQNPLLQTMSHVNGLG
ncbi:hypothetical protein R1flu_019704 [Riccia fluitans]|uniref:Uncharacterized protein n=1 Tax=Riccia fluitans TaxID=41844 RepID=A0ABD1ZLK7_9MARC